MPHLQSGMLTFIIYYVVHIMAQNDNFVKMPQKKINNRHEVGLEMSVRLAVEGRDVDGETPALVLGRIVSRL